MTREEMERKAEEEIRERVVSLSKEIKERLKERGKWLPPCLIRETIFIHILRRPRFWFPHFGEREEEAEHKIRELVDKYASDRMLEL